MIEGFLLGISNMITRRVHSLPADRWFCANGAEVKWFLEEEQSTSKAWKCLVFKVQKLVLGIQSPYPGAGLAPPLNFILKV